MKWLWWCAGSQAANPDRVLIAERLRRRGWLLPTPQTHIVWYLFALCQRTFEVKERCQSVPFGYQRPADGLIITASGFIVNTAGDKKSQAVLMFMIYKIIYFSAHF
ncbi:hypothetical protein SMY42_001321 [Cronobacter sakazakii]|nr:hypothetical protein [Cronobacter sakazakii]ELY4084359.1 hypothetical protein [Cronobacter sakazakii]ELY4358505.1 hypothetical protein [Cronobacter sakazakii]ELY4551546.1 hypothetical protein [Cronobacter sakazakii]